VAKDPDRHPETRTTVLKASTFLRVFFFLPVLPVLSPLGVSAGESGEVPSQVPLVQEALPAARIQALGGYVGRRIALNKDGYLKSFDIDGYVRMVEERKQRDWWWIGEQPGKWLESAVLSSRVSRDAAL